jgi:hypothetical protein
VSFRLSLAQYTVAMRSLSALGIALALALSACSGGAASVPPAAKPSSPSSGFGSYTVTAILEVYPDRSVRACQSMLFSYPGQCGSSVAISGLGNTHLPTDGVAWPRGAYSTPVMQLIGTWTGTSLAVTVPPVQSAVPTESIRLWSATKPPSPAQMHAGYTTEAGFQDQQVLLADYADLESRGIVVLENGFDAVGLNVMVAAGDRATVDLLRSRYRVQTIDSWLVPRS